MIPLLTQSSLGVVQDIMKGVQIPTIAAQSVILNFTTINNDMITWRSRTDEIVFVLQSFLELASPTAVVLIENEGNTTMPLGQALPIFLSDDVDIIIVQYDGDDGNLSSILGSLINTLLRNHSVAFIINVQTYFADQAGCC